MRHTLYTDRLYEVVAEV